MISNRCRVFILVLTLLPAGCGLGSHSRGPTYPVHGKITLKGEPASCVLVSLQPVEGGTGVEANGKTDSNGNFTLTTLADGKEEGAVPGKYRVLLGGGVMLQAGGPSANAKPGIEPVLSNEGDPEDTGVVVEVRAGSNELVIEVP